MGSISLPLASIIESRLLIIASYFSCSAIGQRIYLDLMIPPLNLDWGRLQSYPLSPLPSGYYQATLRMHSVRLRAFLLTIIVIPPSTNARLPASTLPASPMTPIFPLPLTTLLTASTLPACPTIPPSPLPIAFPLPLTATPASPTAPDFPPSLAAARQALPALYLATAALRAAPRPSTAGT